MSPRPEACKSGVPSLEGRVGTALLLLERKVPNEDGIGDCVLLDSAGEAIRADWRGKGGGDDGLGVILRFSVPLNSGSCASPRTVELEEVDVVDSLTESRTLGVSDFDLISPSSFNICPILPDRLRVTEGLLGLCVRCRNPGDGNPGEGKERDEGVEVALKPLGDSLN